MVELYAVDDVNEKQKKVVCVFNTERGDYQYTSYVDGCFKTLPGENPMESYPPSEQREMRLFTAIAYAQSFLEQLNVD